mmetsp:Transcript_31866/g.53761  ORF Transcript_31866/g.53761 Transcript_31866/m.53761 type:complete len:599 (+) Transcript_31866:106-1902(+)
MFSSLSESLFGNSNSPDKKNVNMNPRSGRKGKGNAGASSTVDEDEPSKNRIIESLKNELQIKTAAVQALSAKVERLEDTAQIENLAAVVKRRHHPVVAETNLIGDKGRQRVKIGTRGSIATSNILQAQAETEKTEVHGIAERFVKVFHDPTNYITYLQSEAFAREFMQVCQATSELLEQQPRCLFLQSPVYVFGDIHGNLEDLHFFADNIWKLGMDLTAGKFLFLGDYVDRGMSCLECIAYLFALKVLYPYKIDLLRGNHETRDVNGWELHYQEKSFLYQCKERFGLEMGETVWEECNQTFDRLPLSAVIDHEIFCIHGGIPRPIDSKMTEIESILAMPNIVSIMPAYDHEEDWMKQVGTDCIWSDPASEDMEDMLDQTGFGESPRGGGAVCFGAAAIENFLAANNLSYIIRAHEAHAHGVALSKGARVFTVFSTSKDHRQGSRAMAGCILVDCDKIQVINRSPSYKNKYVHRRTSVALNDLSTQEVEERRRLGLVRFSLAMEDMNRLVTAAGFKEHDDDDDEHDEVTEKARRKASRARAEAEAAANAPDGGGGGLTRPRSANDVLEGVDDDDGDGRQDGKAQEKSEVKTHRPSFTNA